MVKRWQFNDGMVASSEEAKCDVNEMSYARFSFPVFCSLFWVPLCIFEVWDLIRWPVITGNILSSSVREFYSPSPYTSPTLLGYRLYGFWSGYSLTMILLLTVFNNRSMNCVIRTVKASVMSKYYGAFVDSDNWPSTITRILMSKYYGAFVDYVGSKYWFLISACIIL
jgi:hypothetical protein